MPWSGDVTFGISALISSFLNQSKKRKTSAHQSVGTYQISISAVISPF